MKMKNMHMYIYIYINVDIQTSLKRMMKACIPLSLAIVHSEHVVHVCVCLVRPGQEIVDPAVAGRCPVRLHRLRGRAGKSIVRRSRICKGCVLLFVAYQLHVLAHCISTA